MRDRTAHSVFTLVILIAWTLCASWPANAQRAEPSGTERGHSPMLPGLSQPESRAEFEPGRVLVRFRPATPAVQIQAALDEHGATYVRHLLDGQTQLWRVPLGEELVAVEGLNHTAFVLYAEPNYIYRALGTPDDPEFWRQWAHTRMHSTAAWDISTGSPGVTIAIIDSGIDETHPDLAAKIDSGYDFVDDDADPHDLNGHGTHVAGIAAAATNNGTGIAGMDWLARLMPLRALDETGSGYNSDITDAITWAYQQGAAVLNLSLGGPSYSSSMQDAVNAAHTAGSLVVAAMGNVGSSVPMYPAAYDNVLAVAATDPNDVRPGYSNYGSHCDVAAPGGDMSALHDPDGIYSTMPTYPCYLTQQYGYYENYDYLQGTSQACPYVAGLAALVRSLQPSLSPDQVQAILEDTATDLGAPGWDQYYGHGRIDALAALSAVPVVHVGGIGLRSWNLGSDWYLVLSAVRILDAGNQPVPGAEVTAVWILPDGVIVNRQSQTNATGYAAFWVARPLTGRYWLCVVDVTADGYLYDPDQNLETCDTIAVP